jgi:hypothetical protein
MIGATGEGTRNDDRSLDTPTRQFAGVDYGQGIHPGLRREVRRQIGRRSARCATARDPDDKALLLLAQLRHGCAVHSLGAQHIYVVEFRELFGREGFGWTKDHVAGIGDDDVEAAILGDDSADASVDGFV